MSLADCQKDEFGSKEIGPWTEWQGNLDAELMIVGQEWGGSDNYENQKGCDRDRDDTNANLVELLGAIDRRIELPSKYQKKKKKKPEQPHYFTNAVLCLRRGNATASETIDKNGKEPALACFRNCACKFLKPQVDIVHPRVIVSLGYLAYKAVLFSFDHAVRPERTMRGALRKGKIPMGSVQLVPMFHCGARSTKMNRTLEEQKQDWQSVRDALEPQ